MTTNDLQKKAIQRSETFTETKMVTKHFSETGEKTVESFYFPDREGKKRENVKQTLGLNWKISRLITWLLKLESSFIFKDRWSGYFKIHKKKNLVRRGHVTRLLLF